MGTIIINTVQADMTTLSFIPVNNSSWQTITGLTTTSAITTTRTTSKVRVNIIIGISSCGSPATNLYFQLVKFKVV